MMIGIISDIHGQLDSLNQALYLFKHQQVKTVICAGDLVDRGPNGDQVVDIIRKMNIPCVQGNHDARAMLTQDFLARHPNDDLPIDPLRDDTVDFLNTLPLELRFDWQGVSIYITHENPMHDPSKFIYPTSSRSVCATVAKSANSQIVILGHTHRPMHLQMENTHILNPGSVYANHGPYEQTCGVLHLPECLFQLWDIQTGQQLPLTPILHSSRWPDF